MSLDPEPSGHVFHQPIYVEGLRHDAANTQLYQLPQGGRGNVAGHDKGGDLQLASLERAEQVHAVATGHVQVQKHQVHPFCLDKRQCLAGATRLQWPAARVRDDLPQEVPHLPIVVHNKHLLDLTGTLDHALPPFTIPYTGHDTRPATRPRPTGHYVKHRLRRIWLAGDSG